MEMKKVNGKVYYSGTSASPITTRLSIYEVKNGRPDYITQTEFLKALGVKSISKIINSVKKYLHDRSLTTMTIHFQDKKKSFVFTYLNSFSYFNKERADLLTTPDIVTMTKLYEK